MVKGLLPIDRFLAKINPVESGCWEWTGSCHWGYGQFWNGIKQVKAHRFSYEFFNGKVPDGLDLDHLCRNRKCVNPDHLEPVTRSINCLRGAGRFRAGLVKSARTHCQHGHPYTPENTYIRPEGYRCCRTCRLLQKRAWKLALTSKE